MKRPAGRALVALALLVLAATLAAHAFRAPPRPTPKRLRRASARDAIPPGLLARDLHRLLRSLATEYHTPRASRALAVSRGQDEDEAPWRDR